MKKILFFLLSIAATAQLPAQSKKVVNSPMHSSALKKTSTAVIPKPKKSVSKERLVEITTDYGVMVARLYDSTPLHRDNFVKLVQQGFYDSLLFHRVIKDFMIQGGDPTSKNASDTTMLGEGSAPGENIHAEFKNYLFHKRGALAAARDNNPMKSSSNCQFYIVQGKRYDTAQLNDIYNRAVKANKPDFIYTAAQKEVYKRIGGTPFLDQNYTVFGEIISGLNVIDKIANAATAQGDRPVKDIRMKMRLLN